MNRMRPKFPGFFMTPFGTFVSDCEITQQQLADSAVTTIKINDDAVTAAKIADSAVDSGAIADSAVSYQNIQSVTAARLLGRYDAAGGVVQEVTLGGGLTFDSNTGTIASDTTISYTIT